MAKTPSPQPVDDDDVVEAVAPTKGHATPTRKEQEAARKRPLVPSDRRMAARQSRTQVQAARERARIGMAAGDPKYLPARDKGPQKKYVRDYVDARWSLGEVLLPLLVLVIISYFFEAIAPYVLIGVWGVDHRRRHRGHHRRHPPAPETRREVRHRRARRALVRVHADDPDARAAVAEAAGEAGEFPG